MNALFERPDVPAIVIYSVAVIVIGFFLLVIGAMRRELERLRSGGEARVSFGRRLNDAAIWAIHPLMGSDNRLSFSKLICCGILLHYAISANLPAVVACWIIAASFGVKILLAVIEKTGLVANSVTSLAASMAKKTERTETITHHIEERRLSSGDVVNVHPASTGVTQPDERGDDDEP